MSVPHAPTRRRFTAPALLAGVAGSAALAVSLGVSLSAYTASINNSTNTAASNALAVSETNGTFTCNSYDSTATCGTINKYGGATVPLSPGDSKTQTVTFNNTGSVDVATSSLTPSACAATSTAAVGATTPTTPNSTAGNLCSVLQVKVYKGATTTTPLYSGSLAAFTAALDLGTLLKGTSQVYNFVVTLPATATTAVQGQQVSQPLLWTFNQ